MRGIVDWLVTSFAPGEGLSAHAEVTDRDVHEDDIYIAGI
jgi:hypothetical protein